MLADALVRQHAVLDRDDEHDRKLQPLRRVQRHQRGLVGLRVPVVRLVHEPGAFQIFFQLAAAADSASSNCRASVSSSSMFASRF